MKTFAIGMILKAIDQVSGPLSGIEGRFAKFQSKTASASLQVSGAWNQLGKATTQLATRAAVVGGGVFLLGKQFVGAAAEVEKYKTVLVTMLGTQEKANARFEEMSSFAASTPFEISEVVELGNQLQALGRYSIENMTTLGDLAAAAGKPVDQAARAYAKLASGQKGAAVDMFRDLLISTEDWVKATGKGVSKSGQLLATPEQMLEALPKILAAKGFSGMMANQAKTFNGQLSNMMDSVFRFKAAAGEAFIKPVGEMVTKLGELIGKGAEWVSQNQEEFVRLVKIGAILGSILIFTGPIARTALAVINLTLALGKLHQAVKLAGGIGQLLKGFGPGAAKFLLVAGLIALAAYLIYKNWDKISPVLKRVIDGVRPFAPVIAGATAAIWAMNVAMGANPIGLIIVGVAALISGIILLVKNWDKVKAAFMSGIQQIGDFFAGVWEGIKTGATVAFDNIKKSLFTVADVLLTVYGGLVKGILGAVGKVGKFLGIDTTGLDMVIGKITDLQATVRGQSFIGNVAQAPAPATVKTGIGPRAQAGTTTRQVNDSAVTVRFDNLPRGTSVVPTKSSGNMALEMGYAGASF